MVAGGCAIFFSSAFEDFFVLIFAAASAHLPASALRHQKCKKKKKKSAALAGAGAASAQQVIFQLFEVNGEETIDVTKKWTSNSNSTMKIDPRLRFSGSDHGADKKVYIFEHFYKSREGAGCS